MTEHTHNGNAGIVDLTAELGTAAGEELSNEVQADAVEHKRNTAEAARALERARRLDPFTGTIAANRLAAGDWLVGAKPAPRAALLEHPNTDDGGLYLPAGKVAMLVSPGGVGKTTVLMQLAISVATGLPWLDRFIVARPGRVLVALGEEDEAEMHRALYYAARVAGLDRDDSGRFRDAIYQNVVAYPLAGVPVSFIGDDGHETPFYHRLADFIEETGPYSLVILDPGSRFMGAESETDNAAATRFIQCLEAITQTAGAPSVLMAHHTNKGASAPDAESSQADARGSSALVDGVRWVANLRAGKETAAGYRITLTVTKTNYGPKGPPVELLRPRSGYGWRAMENWEIADEIEEREAGKKSAAGAKAGRSRGLGALVAE